jgi:TPR repeat protein
MCRFCWFARPLLLAVLLIGCSWQGLQVRAQTKGIDIVDDLSDPKRVNNRYALVVGVSRYQQPTIRQLPSCVPDAYAMYGFLQRRECWNLAPSRIRLLTDDKARRSDIEDALHYLLAQVHDASSATFYFYFSGHGTYGNILPYDADPHDGSTFLSYTWLRKQLESKGIHSKVFFLDACYAGSALSKGSAEEKLFETTFPSSTNYTCFAAVEADELSLASSSNDHPYSVFTDKLLQGLGERGEQDADQAQAEAADGIVTAGELKTFLQQRLAQAQPPAYSGNDDFPLALSARFTAPGQAEPALPLTEAQLYERGKLAYDAKNYQTAFSYYLQAAKAGNTDGMVGLGICYEYGHGTKPDPAEAVRWYRQAASAGHAEGMYFLGLNYEKAIGLPQDYTNAVYWYRQAAEAGNTNGMVSLGACYKDGRGVRQDAVLGFSWVRQAADAGNPAGLVSQGVCYEYGIGVEKDSVEAIRCYHKAAEAGDTDGMVSLGTCYRRGTVVEKDSVEAVRWFRQAAGAGSTRGMVSLGTCYEQGFGVKRDLAEAVYWYRQAAEAGDTDGMVSLGACYKAGRGIKQNPAEAERWVRQAADFGKQAAKSTPRQSGH